MKRLVAALAVLFLLCGLTSSQAYEDLGLRLSWDDPAFEAVVGDIRDRLERIDAIEASPAWNTAPSDSLRVELVQLYRASPLMKHRVIALELARALSPAARAEQLGLTYAQTYNPWDAEEQLRGWARMEEAGAAAWTREGTFLLDEGLRAMDSAMIEDALAAFRRATQCDDANSRAWLGLASALAATWRYDELRPVAERLLAEDDRTPGPWLYAGLAHEAAGLTHRATGDFEAATERMGARSRARFERPGGIVLEESWGPQFRDLRQAPPPRGIRGWWTRLVESEVLFADPNAGVHGWDTAPGEAYLLFGRPKLMRVHRRGDSLAEFVMGDLTVHHEDAIKVQAHTASRGHTDLWVWLVPLRSGRDAPLVFSRFSRFAKWVPSDALDQTILHEQRKAGAIRLAQSLPRLPDAASAPELSLLCRGFRAGDERWRVEAWVATRAAASAPTTVQLTLTDADGKTLDTVRSPCDAEHSRAGLRRHFEEIPAAARGWIHGLGALVDAGELRVTVEVLDADDRVLASQDAALDFPARSRFHGLAMSELMACDVYREELWSGPLDPAYRRHGMAVIPRPEIVLTPGQAELGLYYELFGAAVDASGRTRLDVDYAVYRVDEFDPYVHGPAHRDGRPADPVFRARFPDERTGRSPEGAVIKGTRIPLEELPPGGYVVLTVVEDRLGRQETRRSLPFVVAPAP